MNLDIRHLVGWDEQKEAPLEDEEAQQHHEGEAEEVKES